MTFIVDGTAGLTYPNSTVQASAGVVLQVVNAVIKTPTDNATTTFASSAITASITPKFTTSKILVTISVLTTSNTAGTSCIGSIYRNSSAVSASTLGQMYVKGNSSIIYAIQNISYLDSPASTSAQTYNLYFKSGDVAGTATVGNNNCDSTITLMEIAG